MSDTPVLEVARLSHTYKKQKALNAVSFKVESSSIHGFIGPNGAGKTTTLRILSTLMKPQSGTARVYGYDVARHYKQVRQKIGFMPDHFSMYRQMTVFEYLDFFAAAYGMSMNKRNQTISDVLELTDMIKCRDDYIRGLSRGMQQRIALARVLVHDPDLLLLDEPASGLDPRARIELMEILRELRGMGKTIFISSHILTELADLCDSVTIIDRGQIKYSGPLKELQRGEGETFRYRLDIDGPNETLTPVLENMDGVIEVTGADGDGMILIEFNPAEVDSSDILSAVIAQNMHIISWQEDLRHLNSAFMELTTPGVAR